MIDRRALMLATAALGACSRGTPAVNGDVLAAGQPAAILIWALAPQRLIGWPRRPSDKALALLPDTAAGLPQTGALVSGGAPMGLEAAAAFEPALILDYGDLDAADLAVARQVRERLDAPYRLIDGALERIPEALVEAGGLLGASERAQGLADLARVLLSAPSTSGAQAFYYARGADGLETAFQGALATEVLERSGWSNVATGGADIGRVSREQVLAWDPEVVVTLDRRFAETAADDPVWRARPGGGRRRLLLLPDAPFGWIDRPPSINRLLGLAWMAQPDNLDRLGALIERLFGRAPSAAQMAALAPRWIA